MFKVIFDGRWLTFIYLLLTVITGIDAIFHSSFGVGAGAIGACALCYIGPAGFVGTYRARHEQKSGAIQLGGVAAIAAALTAAGLSLMIWSGFGLRLDGLAIPGLYWGLIGSLIALLVTRKEDIQ